MHDRYLINADLSTVPSLTAQTLVIGSGIAGLASALAAAENGPVLILAKDNPAESNSYHAQGGIAVALSDSDSPELHLQDTLTAGAGLCNEAAVRCLVWEGVERCRELLAWGTPFDRHGDAVAFTREAAHSCNRILHAAGDSTGKAVIEILLAKVRDHPRIRILENHFAIDLLHHENECYGALALDTVYGRLLCIEAGGIVVATGGLGRIYRETTNPEVATGDGYAMCARAGAILQDMEFVQFHPTALYLAGAPRFLISEAVRGEGAHLINLRGERFMARYAPDGELAPRDVVSQAIFKEINLTGTTHVLLDLRHLSPALIDKRFPSIRAVCANYGLDITKDPIPVRPAAHYMMGGVQTDLDGRTSLRRLYAAGEVACVGVHGANRLASNSLLEGLVFGRRAGLAAAAEKRDRVFPLAAIRRSLASRAVPLDIDDVLQSLRSLMWRHLGVYRNGSDLAEAENTIVFWQRYVLAEQFQARRGFEAQNLLTIARFMVRAARLRTESRGAHQRADYPNSDPAWQRHVCLRLEDLD